MKEALEINRNRTRLKPGTAKQQSKEEMTGQGAAGAESCSSASKAKENYPNEDGRGGFGLQSDF